MKTVHTLATLIILSCSCGIARAQGLVGSTSLDVDPNSGYVTATCETDFNGDDGSYQAIVRCIVTDSNGTRVASGVNTDVGDQNGYAQVVLTFSGVPGMTYTATGVHYAQAIFSQDVLPQPHQPGYTSYYDPYNFTTYEGSYQTYPDYYEWPAYGPEVQRTTSLIKIGSTTDTKTLQYCPTTVTIKNTFSRSLPSNDLPSALTGIGLLSQMLVSPSVSDYSGVKILEQIIPTSDSCPDSIKPYTGYASIVTSFTVGGGASFEGIQFSPFLNVFYDQHVDDLSFDVLGSTLSSSCAATATQIYTCNDQTIGTFSLTRNFQHGSLSGKPVTNVNVIKR